MSLELQTLLDEAHQRADGIEDLGDGPLEPLQRLLASSSARPG